MQKLHCALRLALVMGLGATPLIAQQSAGPWVSAQNGVVSLQPMSTDGTLGIRDHGTSWSYRLGYRGDSTVSAYVAATRTTLPTSDPTLDRQATYQEVEVGARLQFPRVGLGRLHPVLDLAIIQRQYRASLSATGAATFGAQALQMSGLGVGANAGFVLNVLPGIDVEAVAGVTVGQFNSLTVGGVRRAMSPVEAEAGRARVGLVLSPSAWWR